MRYIISVLAIAIIGSIIVSGLVILADSDEISEIREQLYEKYDIEDYFRELRENGISTWNPGRLWPGSLGSPQAGPYIGDADVPASGFSEPSR